jgi:tRNA G26 N,N-dimethylase Trm1
MTDDLYHCSDCGLELTAEEMEYLETRCETCEIEYHLRLRRWQAGATDYELDREYGVTIH